MNKVAVIVVFLVCSIFFVQGNNFRNFLVERVYAYLKDEFKDNPVKAECMIDLFQSRKIGDTFYAEDIIANPQELKRELQPFIDEAYPNCTAVAFYESPLGIFIGMVAVFLSFIAALFIVKPNPQKKPKKSVSLKRKTKVRIRKRNAANRATKLKQKAKLVI